jgi:FkbM family methyltransferase
MGVPRELLREGVFFGAGLMRATLEVRWPSGRYRVASADLDVSRRTFVSGPYGLERLLRAGELIERETGIGLAGREVLEIGANIGTTTVPLITVLGAARVHAFEPIARNFALLSENVALNGLDERVVLERAAISDHDGTLSLSVPERFWGSSRVTGEHRDSQSAPCTTIDSLIAAGSVEPAKLGLVWIDVEGHEAAVLAGARSLPASVPLVLEHDPGQQADLAALHAEIARRGGRLYDLSSGDAVSLGELGPDATDLLLLP